MTVRDLMNILDDVEDKDTEIVIETDDGTITEVELEEPDENDEDLVAYKLVAIEYI